MVLQSATITIGSIIIPHVTFADGLAQLATDQSHTQVMVWDADNGARREKYCIHPTKSSNLVV